MIFRVDRFHFAMAMFIYNVLFHVGFVLYLPVFVIKLWRRGGVSGEYGERFGRVAAAKRQALQALGNPVWVHAVSVGEVVAALSFVRRWQERDPGRPLVLSTTTTTGHALARKKLPPGVMLMYCPLDFWWAVRRMLDLVAPVMLVIFEVEYWPNLVRQARARGTDVVLANGRMSDRSAAGYARHRWFFGPLFRCFSVFCVQTEETAERIRRVAGAEARITVCNTMKFDQVPDSDGADKSAVLEACFGPGSWTVWTAGSTHPGEEALVATVYRHLRERFPRLRLILVPRHVERTREVAEELRDSGLSFRLLEPSANEDDGGGPADVLLVNTTGELMNFYAVSDVVFVGKSLAGNDGGHNIIEPAIFGKPIVHGQAMSNFREVADLFQKGEAAIQVSGDDEFAAALERLLADDAERRRLGERARALVDRYRGAIDRTLDTILPLLEGGTSTG